MKVSQNNARIIEKDIFSNQVGVLPATSEVVELFGSEGGPINLSFQATYEVQSPSPQDFYSGAVQVDQATFQSKALTGSGDFIAVWSALGSIWAIAADLTGSDPEPETSRWFGIPAAQRAQVDLSAATTATDVATAFKNAFNALPDVPFVTDNVGADCTFTMNTRGGTNAPYTYNYNATSQGSISASILTPGVYPSVDTETNAIYIYNHGFTTGYKVQLTTTGTLPSPFLTGTDYFIINYSSYLIQLAATVEDAFNSIPIDLTTLGSNGAVNTITGVPLDGATVTFQSSNDGITWGNIQSPTAITSSGSTLLNSPNLSFRYFRALKGLTSGLFNLQGNILVIGDAT